MPAPDLALHPLRLSEWQCQLVSKGSTACSSTSGAKKATLPQQQLPSIWFSQTYYGKIPTRMFRTRMSGKPDSSRLQGTTRLNKQELSELTSHSESF
eukprot:2056413-Amphidinium_carterae.1